MATRQTREGKHIERPRIFRIGGPHEAVAPSASLSVMVDLIAPKPTALTAGAMWDQLLGHDVVTIKMVLSYDDGYGDLMTQDLCQFMFNKYNSDGTPRGVFTGDCNNLSAVLARDRAE